MCGYTRMDRISNGVIRDLVKLVPIKHKLRKIRLRWFDHVKRRSTDALVRRCERINIPKVKERRDDQKRVWTR